MSCFTHVDPFEDTESFTSPTPPAILSVVSPTSIRSRILKVQHIDRKQLRGFRFTHVDPFEDTESAPSNASSRGEVRRFTHVDPFEDTERPTGGAMATGTWSFTHVDPFEDTERLRVGLLQAHQERFTHVDPFEDTESGSALWITDNEQ